MSALVLTPQGSRTFDVEQDGRVLGSVWHYRDGWMPYRHTARHPYESLRVFYDTVDDAVRALGGRP